MRRRNKDRKNNPNAQNPQNGQSAVPAQNPQNGQGQQNQPKKQNPQNGRDNRGMQGGGNKQNRDNRNRDNRDNRNKNGKGNKGGNNQNQNAKGQNRAEENRKDTYVYAIDGTLYVNLTNKCSNGCDFCVRNERSSYFGHYLWIKHGDPTAEKVIAAINGFGDIKKYKELVFCGFGEPTYKISEMCAVADYAHEKGMTTRLNTNGQGNLINKRDIVPELKGKIDKVNVSLNAPDAESYQKICRSMFGTNGFEAMVEFAKSCKKNGIDCWFSVVDCIGEDAVESCKKLAEKVNVPLRVRAYITES